MTAPKAPLPDDFMGCHVHNNVCDCHCPYRNNPVGNIMFIITDRVSSDGRAYVLNYIAALKAELEKVKLTAAGHYLNWQLKEAALEAENKRLREALKGALGYLRNARIDLETGAPKRTAINTLGGGIAMVDTALAQTGGDT